MPLSRSRRAALSLGAALLAACLGRPAHGGETFTARLTVYLDHGVQYAGTWTAWGSAACSWNLPIGTRLRLPDGYEVTCLDRGRLGNTGWVDLWAPDWETGAWLQAQYGDWTTVEVVQWGRE